MIDVTLPSLREGRVLLTGMLLPRIARQGTVCLSSIRGYARKALIEKFELAEGSNLIIPPSDSLLAHSQWPRYIVAH